MNQRDQAWSNILAVATIFSARSARAVSLGEFALQGSDLVIASSGRLGSGLLGHRGEVTTFSGEVPVGDWWEK